MRPEECFHCRVPGESRYSHSHKDYDSYRNCTSPQYAGTPDSADMYVIDLPRGGKPKFDPHKSAPIDSEVEESTTITKKSTSSTKALPDPRTPEQREADEAEQKAKKEAAKREANEKHLRELRSQKATVDREIAGLEEDNASRQRRAVAVGGGYVVAIAVLLAAAFASTLGITAFAVVCFAIGGIFFGMSTMGGFAWYAAYYANRPPSVPLAGKRADQSDLQTQIARYADLVAPEPQNKGF